MRFLAVTSMRNEGPFILEWLAHHRAVGFTDFLVFSNDCDDGTDAILDRLQELGALTHIRNQGPFPEGPQWSALKTADKHPLTKAADWLMFLDVDEFVNIHIGDHSLPALLAALPDATAIPLTWRFFGNAGKVAFDDQPVLETFTRAAPSVLQWPWQAAMFKTLFRNNGCYRKLGVHRPRNPDKTRLAAQRWFDGAGRELPPEFRREKVISPFARDNYTLAQLNHYPLGAMESFLVKCDRGRANRRVTNFDMGYWIERNFDASEDRSIDALKPQRDAIRCQLLADQNLSDLHLNSVTWRKSRFLELMQEQDWRTLFGRLMLAAPTRVLDAQEARLIWMHAQPRCDALGDHTKKQ